MGTNWNTKRPEPSITELTEEVASLQAEATEALKTGGEYGRPYRGAAALLAVAERQLEAAKEREAQKQRLSNLTPGEIVDRAMDKP